MDYGKKPTLRDKFNALVRKVLLGTAMCGAVATPLWYQYGTVHTAEVKITSVEPVWTEKKDDFKFERYDVFTSEGQFKADESFFHGQKEQDIDNINYQIKDGKTYQIRYYGVRFDPPLLPGIVPNLLDVRLVTDKELKERADAKKAKAEAAAQRQAQGQQQRPAGVMPGQQQLPAQQQPVPQQPSGAFSGEVVTYPVTVNGYSVQLTVPVEIVGKATVNTVKPLTPPGS